MDYIKVEKKNKRGFGKKKKCRCAKCRNDDELLKNINDLLDGKIKSFKFGNSAVSIK